MPSRERRRIIKGKIEIQAESFRHHFNPTNQVSLRGPMHLLVTRFLVFIYLAILSLHDRTIGIAHVTIPIATLLN